MNTKRTGFAAILAIAMTVGCETGETDTATTTQPDEPAGSAWMQATQEAQEKREEERRKAAEQPKTPPPTERVKAEVGVGRKGHSYGGGVITEPARQRWRAEERIVFTSLDHAENLYQAQHGELPKTTEEYMEKIVEYNKINLPELRPDERYVWDAEKAELMVERPQR